MINQSGWVRIDRAVWRDLRERINRLASEGRGQRPNIGNIKAVLHEIIINTAYGDTADGRWKDGYWHTTYKEISDLTGISRGQVRSALNSLKRITQQDTQQGQKSLMLLEIQTLTKNQHDNSAGLGQLEQANDSKLNRSGIRIKPLFYKALTCSEAPNSTGSNAETQPVISKKYNNLEKKKDISSTAEPEPCTLEPVGDLDDFAVWNDNTTTAEPEHIPIPDVVKQGTGLAYIDPKVKPELVQEDTHRSFDSRPKPTATNAIKQDPVRASEPMAETKRIADTKTTGKTYLTAQRGGMTYEQAKEQYPQLENAVKYLTYLNDLGVAFYKTHLEDLSKAIKKHDNKPNEEHDKPIAQALLGFRRKKESFDTIEAALEKAVQDKVLGWFASEPEPERKYAWGGR